MGKPVDTFFEMGRRVTFEIPDRNHDVPASLLTRHGKVTVYHAELEASFGVPQWLNPKGHFVYIVWGENAIEENGEDYDVLYIGMSSTILMRIAQHATHSDWWVYAERIDLYQYATRDAALEVEQYLIANYGPLYNVHYKRVTSIPLDKFGVPTGEHKKPSA